MSSSPPATARSCLEDRYIATNLNKEGFKTFQEEEGDAYSATEESSVSDVAEVIGIGVNLSDAETISRAP